MTTAGTNIDVHWLANSADSQISFYIEYPWASGWVGFGIGKQERSGLQCAMTGADIAWVGENDAVEVYHSSSCVQPVKQSVQLPAAVATRVNEKTQLEITRGLDPLTSQGPTVSLSSEMTIIVAYDSQTSIPSYHLDGTRFKAVIDLSASPNDDGHNHDHGAPPPDPTDPPTNADGHDHAHGAPPPGPTDAPTGSPVARPTRSPVIVTGAPVPPVGTPTGSPTAFPVPIPSGSPVTAAPTNGPTRPPVTPTTDEHSEHDHAHGAGPDTSPSSCATPRTANGYTCVSAEAAQLNLFWTLRNDNKVDLALQSTAGTGWITLGFGTRMLGSTVYSAGADGSGGWYEIGNSYSSGAITPLFDSANTITFESANVDLNAQGLTLELRGVSLLNPADARLIWSYSPSGTFPQVPHLPSTRAAGTYNFETGQVTVTSGSSKWNLVKVHAWLLVIAWCYVCPLAIMAKALPPVCGLSDTKLAGMPIGFVFHAVLMGIVFIMSISGLSIAVSEFDSSPGKGHGKLGWAVVILSALQIAAGVFRPKPGEPQTSLRSSFNIGHRIVGVAIMAFATTNVFTGADYIEKSYDSNQKFTITAAIGLAVMFSILIIGMVLRQVKGKQADQDADKPTTREMPVTGRAPESQSSSHVSAEAKGEPAKRESAKGESAEAKGQSAESAEAKVLSEEGKKI